MTVQELINRIQENQDADIYDSDVHTNMQFELKQFGYKPICTEEKPYRWYAAPIATFTQTPEEKRVYASYDRHMENMTVQELINKQQKAEDTRDEGLLKIYGEVVECLRNLGYAPSEDRQGHWYAAPYDNLRAPISQRIYSTNQSS